MEGHKEREIAVKAFLLCVGSKTGSRNKSFFVRRHLEEGEEEKKLFFPLLGLKIILEGRRRRSRGQKSTARENIFFCSSSTHRISASAACNQPTIALKIAEQIREGRKFLFCFVDKSQPAIHLTHLLWPRRTFL